MNITKALSYLGLLGLFLVPSLVSAQSLLLDNDYSTAGTSHFRDGLNVQKIAYKMLATTTVWTINSVSFEGIRDGSDPANAAFRVIVYKGGALPEAGSTVGVSDYIASATIGTSADWIDFFFDDAITIDSSQDYWFVMESTDLDDPSVQMIKQGGANDWRYCPGCGGANWQDGGDTWSFRIYGGAEGTNTALFSNLIPGHGDTVLTEGIDFSFNYFIDFNHIDYDKVGITITDLTTNQSVNSVTEGDISGYGSHLFERSVGLPLGHIYQWYAYIYDEDTFASSTPLLIKTSPSVTFYTSTLLGTSTLPESFFASTSPVIGFTYGSSTVNSFDPSSYLPAIFADIFKTKFPFSYIYDIYTLISELASGTSIGNVSMTLPSGATFNGNSSVTLVDFTALRAVSLVSTTRTILSYLMYVLTAFYVVKRVMSFI